MALIKPAKIDGLTSLVAWRGAQTGDTFAMTGVRARYSHVACHLQGDLDGGKVMLLGSLDGADFSPLTATFKNKLAQFVKDNEPRLIELIPMPRFIQPLITKDKAGMLFDIVLYYS